METLIVVVHLLIALAIIALVLMQQGKGAEAGASFGAGASQTMFGSVGSWNFFSRVTAILAALFFVSSITLAVMAKNRAVVGGDYLPELEMYTPALEESMPTEQEIPALPQSNSASDIPVIE